jgi:hypothetical protein
VSGVEYEELAQGQAEDDPARPHTLTWVALAVACVVAGMILLLLRAPAEPVAAPSSPSPTTRSSTTGPFAGRLGGSGINSSSPVPQSLGLGRICSAVTDGRRTLALSFTLVNISSKDVTLIDVTPQLPIGGLRPLRPNTAGGTCEHPGREAPGGLLIPGATQLITMRFRLPEECPQPFPVQARVKLRANHMVGTTTVGIYSDLGAIDFDTCPDPQ